MRYFIARTSVRPGFLSRNSVLIHTWRFQSSKVPHSAWRQALTTDSPLLVQENFPKHFVFVLDVGKRFIKFSLIGLVFLGVATGSAFEGAHLWAEKHGLAPDSDHDVKKWQWQSDADKWTGDPASGGTDPGLGFRARHLVRAAWMTYTWGIGHTTTAIGSHDNRGSGLTGPTGIKVINPQLQLTEDFLRAATRLAKSSPEDLYPHTLSQLFTLHGTVLEKLGSDFYPEAKSDLEYAWASLATKGFDGAHIALKLGDLSSRLGLDAKAVEWWTRALQLITGTGESPKNIKKLVPDQPPSSPLAQRLLSSTLVSLSAHYAKSGQYHMAESIQENALSVLRAIAIPDSLESASAPQALHALFLLQRSSILSIHLAEVKHALRDSLVSPFQWLTLAAESSERVARALTGLPLIKSAEFSSKNYLPHPLEERLLTSYSTSRSMKPVAEALLRDARRTAAEAWNLMGILYEAREGSNCEFALKCFERAVEWAGSSPGAHGEREAAEGIPNADWKVFWDNYQRARNQLLVRGSLVKILQT